jgi:hypothetical protein
MITSSVASNGMQSRRRCITRKSDFDASQTFMITGWMIKGIVAPCGDR